MALRARLFVVGRPVPLAVLFILCCSTTCSMPQTERRHARSSGQGLSGVVSGGRSYQRVEDLPVEPVRRVEDLPVAPPVAVRPLRPIELTPALIRVADRVLWRDDPPLGTEIAVRVEGNDYIARLEMHFHDVGGPVRPWGYHKGVTLYATQ